MSPVPAGDLPSACSCETSPGVLCLGLGFSAEQKCAPARAGPEEGTEMFRGLGHISRVTD